jgi:enoyl-CoA hydratase
MKTPDGSRTVLLDFAATIAVVRFNQPTRRNPLSRTTLNQLEEILTQISERSECTAIVFTGTGNTFASGADIRELATLDAISARQFAGRGQKLFQQISDAPQRTIAAINGYCMGGALDLALACDVRLASINAVFAHPGARLGIITGWGGTQRLPRLIGKARALELFLTTRRLGAQEALEIGLVSEIADPVLEAAIQYGAKR